MCFSGAKVCAAQSYRDPAGATKPGSAAENTSGTQQKHGRALPVERSKMCAWYLSTNTHVAGCQLPQVLGVRRRCELHPQLPNRVDNCCDGTWGPVQHGSWLCMHAHSPAVMTNLPATPHVCACIRGPWAASRGRALPVCARPALSAKHTAVWHKNAPPGVRSCCLRLAIALPPSRAICLATGACSARTPPLPSRRPRQLPRQRLGRRCELTHVRNVPMSACRQRGLLHTSSSLHL